MAEGVFGVALPFTFSGSTLGVNDHFKICIKKSKNGETIPARGHMETRL